MKTDDDRSNELKNLVIQEDDEEKKAVNYMDKCKGFLAAGVCVSMITVSAASCQLLEKRIPDFELNTIRLVISWTMMVTYLLAKRKLPKVDLFKMGVFIIHSICTTGLTLPYFIAVTLTSVTSVHCVLITSSITAGLFIFLVVAKEKITVIRVFCAFFCITGVILVVQPDMIFLGIQENNDVELLQAENSFLNDSETTQNIPQQTGNTTHLNEQPSATHSVFSVLGLVLPIISGISMSSQTALVKTYPFVGEDVTITAFWSLIFCTIVSAVLMGIFENLTLPQNWMDVLFIGCHSFSYGIILTTSLIVALYISGNTMNIIFSTTVVIMLLPQYTVLSSIHPGHRNWIEVLGVVLVLLGSSFGSIVELLSGK